MLQLLHIAQSRRQLLFKFFGHFYAMARKIVTPQLDGLPQNAVHLNQLALHGPLPREAQQILDDILRPLGFLQDNFQILLRRRRDLGILQQ